MTMKFKKTFNISKLGKQYENLKSQIDRGKRISVRQGNRKVFIHVPWNETERRMREIKMDGLLTMLTKVKNIYDSERLKEPAIKTISPEQVLVYMPLSKTGYSLYQIEQFRNS